MDNALSGAGLARFWRAFLLEARLLTWNFVYPILHILWLALLMQMFFQRDNRSAQALLETTVGGFSIGLISLAAIFIAGISASRSARARFGELEDSFATGSEVIFARWLAGLAVVSLFLIQPIGMAAARGPLISLMAGLPRFVGEALLTIAFTLAATWGLSSWVRLGRWAYPLLAAGWLAFFLGPALLAERLPWMNLFNFMRLGRSYYSELFDRLAYARLPLWFNLFYAGLLLLVLALLSARVVARRYQRPAYPALSIALLALALTGWAGYGYIADIQAALVQPQANPQAVEPPDLDHVPTDPLVVDAYDISLDMSDPAQARFQALLTVRNPGPAPITRLDWLLEPSLEVTQANRPFTRQGSRLRFTLDQPLPPGESLSLAVAYQGRIWRTVISDLLPNATDFITPRGVRLSPAVAWYPRPLLEPTSARFRLAVTGADGDLHFGSNLPLARAPQPGAAEFLSADASWVFLVGSPQLVTEQVGDLTLVTTWADLLPARQAAAAFSTRLHTVRRFFPTTPVNGLTLMVLDEEPGLPPGTPPADGRVVVVSSRAPLEKMVDYSATSILFEDLWLLSGETLTREGGEVSTKHLIVRTFGSFLNRYHAQSGDPDRIEAALLASCPASSELKKCDLNLAALLDVLRQQGEPGLVRLLAQMRERPAELNALSYDRAADWIREVTGVR